MTPVTPTDDGAGGDSNNSHRPTMATLLAATELSARPLSIVRDDIAAAVEALDERIAASPPTLRGEISKLRGPVLTLFRHATTQRRPSVIDIPTDLCTPYVYGKLYELLCAIEEEEASLLAHSGYPAAVGPHREA